MHVIGQYSSVKAHKLKLADFYNSIKFYHRSICCYELYNACTRIMYCTNIFLLYFLRSQQLTSSVKLIAVNFKP